MVLRAVHQRRDGREAGADGERRHDRAVDVDAHERGRLLILGHGAHGAAELRLLHEDLQRRHDNGCDDDRDHGRHVHGHAAEGHRRRAEDLIGDHTRVRAHGRNGLREVFQQQAHGDGRDEGRHARALAAHGPVGHQLDQNTHERADHNGRDHARPRRQTHAVQQDRHGEIQRIAADHDEVAVCKVDKSDDTVNHRVAQRHERIDAAEAEPDDQLL